MVQIHHAQNYVYQGMSYDIRMNNKDYDIYMKIYTRDEESNSEVH